MADKKAYLSKAGLSKPAAGMVMSRGRKRVSISFHQLRTTASKALVQTQIIADAFGTPPCKPRIRDALWAVLSIVRRRLLPRRLRRVSTFDASAREIICSFATQHTAALWAVLSLTPIVRCRLSPLRLRRVSSFEVYCEETRVLPKRIGCNGFICRFSKRRRYDGLNLSASTKTGRWFGIAFDTASPPLRRSN
jgi:hypothetical protein